MDELIDVVDVETGRTTGKTVFKSKAHTSGIWHSSIHILLINGDHTKTLLQKRCADKKLYPNTWDIAVGGHIGADEDATESAKRELKEELGLDANKYNLEYIKTVPESLNNNGVISNEFVNMFVLCANIDINELELQEEEVSEAKWVTLDELNLIIENKNIIPHIEDFQMLNKIMNN